MVGKKQISVGTLLICLAGFQLSVCEKANGQRRGNPFIITMNSNISYEGPYTPTNGFQPFFGPPVSNPTTYAIDEGPRRVFVNRKRIASQAPSDARESEFPIWQTALDDGADRGYLIEAGQFNEKGHRILTVQGKNGPASYVQAITKIRHQYVELNTLKGIKGVPKRNWKMNIGLGLVPPKVINNLLHNEIAKPDKPGEYLDIFEFYVLAQQYQYAEEELKLILQKFPDMSDRIEDLRVQIRQSQARQVLDRMIKMRFRNGQLNLAREIAEAMNTDGVAPQLLEELNVIIGQIRTQEEKVTRSRERVVELVQKFRKQQGANIKPDQDEMMERFLRELASELRPSNVDRLDGYLVQADDVDQQDQQKIALAVSGWLMGSNNATANFAVAESMFTVRDLIEKYLRTPDEANRHLIVEQLKKFEAGAPEFLARMLAQMKPLDHEKAVEGYTGEKPIQFTVTVPGVAANPRVSEFPCAVHLPSDYDPYRKYPLLITLCDGNSAQRQLNLFAGRWLDGAQRRVREAIQDGYIVLAVQWLGQGQNVPGYKSGEHATVLRAMRKCFRSFSVDTDRVFMHGFGIAANMVYDIGLAHPHHFAGIIPVSGTIERYARIHALNEGIPLAVRGVVGESDHLALGGCVETWSKWLKSDKYVNFTAVSYKGRLNERFQDDHKSMFEWMQFQQRQSPTRNGFEFSVKSLRPFDNYFWFLQLRGFPVANVTWPELWTARGHKPLKIAGKMKSQLQRPNDFNVDPASGGESMTLWLNDDYFDFTQPIRISGRGREFKGDVRPSVSVILEHVRKHGDRLHPAWARVDCIDGRWYVAE